MTRNAEQVMHAAKYLGNDTIIKCVCCGHEGYERNHVCGKCQIPFEISSSVQSRGTKPNFIPVLGASGAGKTVYIGLLLDILSKGKNGLVGLPANSYSVAVQQQTIAALERRHFPDKTVCESEEWQWVHCEVAADKKGKKYVNLVTPDLAGESLAMELDHPGSCQAIKTCVSNAEAVIVLVDAVRARDGGSDEDLFATKLLTYLHQFGSTTGLTRKRLRIPVAVTFTKCDLCPEAETDPVAFANHNLPSLLKFCERNVAKIDFFAASAVGATATAVEKRGDRWQIPMDVQPQGIVTPVAWLINA